MKNRALLVAIGIFGASLIALAAGNKNLVSNSGFEQGMLNYEEKREHITPDHSLYPSGFIEKKKGNVSADYDVSHEGLISLKLDASKGNNFAEVNTTSMLVNAGKRYRLSCYIKNDTAIEGKGFSILILQEGADNVLGWLSNGGNVQNLSVTKEATDGWVKKEVMLDGFLPGTTKVKAYFRLEGKGVVNIDDVSLDAVKTMEIELNGANPEKDYAYENKDFRVWVNRSQAPKGENENYLTNSN